MTINTQLVNASAAMFRAGGGCAVGTVTVRVAMTNSSLVTQVYVAENGEELVGLATASDARDLAAILMGAATALEMRDATECQEDAA